MATLDGVKSGPIGKDVSLHRAARVTQGYSAGRRVFGHAVQGVGLD